MADFTVFTNAAGSHDAYTDGATFNFDEHGHLVTTRPGGERVVYGPLGWLRLEEHHGAPGILA